MSDLKNYLELKSITYVHGKKDPTPVELAERGVKVFSFNPLSGWRVKGVKIKDGNLSITIGKDKPLTWDDFTFYEE